MRRTVLFVLAFLMVITNPALAGWVNHRSQSGVIATLMYGNPSPGFEFMLTSTGEVWRFQPWTLEWNYYDYLTPPVPVSDLEWWDVWTVITRSGDIWRNAATEWLLVGQIPETASALDMPSDRPSELMIHTSPNPMSSSCVVSFNLPTEDHVVVRVFDVSGRLIRHLLDGSHPPGDYSLLWDGRDDVGREVQAGAYFAKIQKGQEARTVRVVLVK